MEFKKFRIYNLLNLIFPKSFKYKVFFVAFISTHIPLISIATYVFLNISSVNELIWPLILMVTATVVASVVAMHLLHHLLKPIYYCVSVLKDVQENVFRPLPNNLQDEIGFLMKQLNEFVFLHQELDMALTQMDTANREKDAFISVMNHELRTPLTSLRGAVSIALIESRDSCSDRIRNMLEIADRNGKRLSGLIENILVTQKLDIDEMELKYSRVDAHSLLENSFRDNETFSSSCRLELVKPGKGEAFYILADKSAVRQIIDNLLSNAMKFSAEGTTVKGEVKINNNKVRLSVVDCGEGIPDGMEEVVFGRFKQVSVGKQGSTQGSGLGLFVSRKLANKMSAKLSYESHHGQGTEFYLEFDRLE
ncbi:sensor histidine kinase KdpD [Salipiger sp. IMCC34102]|uniref:sensor histidine kinase n=1 Tax=Salipiger sp. IMCC34102 TaxID=2510647 RepID=UPI0013EE0D43|nr:HAMP domain-containing sensor histidine kinase [Salipiger sp. IMCC34102]